MVSWKALALAAYAISLIIAGAYGYVVTTTAQTLNNYGLCSSSFHGTALPACLPSQTLAETGSASLYPLIKQWVRNFTQLYPNVQINTENSGSGTGQSFVEQGRVLIGGSSTFLTDSQQAQFPNILNIPLAVTADIIEYNIIISDGSRFPENIHLNFTAPLLARIYNSSILYWNDPQIKQLNPGAANLLPNELIWPTYRSDPEGDTFVFTKYLSAGDPWWNSTVGYGLQVNWPSCPSCLSSPQSSLGNPGIVLSTGKRAGSVSYVSVEALDQWVLCKTQDPLCKDFAPLGYGFLQNKAGNFVDGTNLENVEASINALSNLTPGDERFSLVNAPGANSYPIVGYEYALVSRQPPNSEFGLVLRTFLRYCLLSDYGNTMAFLGVYHFAPLPDAIVRLSLNQVATISP